MIEKSKKMFTKSKIFFKTIKKCLIQINMLLCVAISN